MVLPLWKSLYSLNLMLPKEERRAMLLRLFNDDTPLVNTTKRREVAKAARSESATPALEAAANGDGDDIGDIDEVDNEDGGVLLETTGKEEEEAIKQENLSLRQEVDEAMKARQSFVTTNGEDDVMNTTV